MKKYIDISIIEDWLKGQLEKVQDGADPFSAGKEMAYKEVLKYLVEKKQKNARQRLAEWSQTPEGRASYERVAEEMRKQIAELPKIKGWAARYANGDLEVGREKPRYYEDEGKTYITDPCPTIPLDKSWFPELHWLDEPIEVELTISRVIKNE